MGPCGYHVRDWGGVFRAAAEPGPRCSLQPGVSVGPVLPLTRAPLPQQHFPEPAMSFTPVPTGPGQPMPSGHQVSAGCPSLWPPWVPQSAPTICVGWSGPGCRWELGRVSCGCGPTAVGGASLTYNDSPKSSCPGLLLGGYMHAHVLVDFFCHVSAPGASLSSTLV